MSRKRKRPAGGGGRKRRDAPGREQLQSTLADRLGRQLEDHRDTLANRPPPPDEPPAEPTAEPRRLTEEELMAEAFAAAGDGETIAAKFSGRGYDPGDVSVATHETESVEESADAGPDLHPDDLVFIEAMAAEVERIPEDDRSRLADKDWVGASWHTAGQLERLSDEDLHEPGLSGAQRSLLKRSRRAGTMPVLNIRRERARQALGALEAFIRGSRARNVRFVRVIHGKGRRSEGDPVLKPAVVQWCETEGAEHVLDWAPETDRSGEYGSVVIELARARRRRR